MREPNKDKERLLRYIKVEWEELSKVDVNALSADQYERWLGISMWMSDRDMRDLMLKQRDELLLELSAPTVEDGKNKIRQLSARSDLLKLELDATKQRVLNICEPFVDGSGKTWQPPTAKQYALVSIRYERLEIEAKSFYLWLSTLPSRFYAQWEETRKSLLGRLRDLLMKPYSMEQLLTEAQKNETNNPQA